MKVVMRPLEPPHNVEEYDKSLKKKLPGIRGWNYKHSSNQLEIDVDEDTIENTIKSKLSPLSISTEKIEVMKDEWDQKT